MLTDDEIQKIDDRYKRGLQFHKGCWHAEPFSTKPGEEPLSVVYPHGLRGHAGVDGQGIILSSNLEEIFGHAWEDAPRLIETVRELQRQLAQAKSDNELGLRLLTAVREAE
jgi:hypothetical protein